MKEIIFEQDYKWIVCFIEELGFSNVSYFNNGLNQEFIHQNKNQKIFLSIELSPRRKDWDVINIQLISNKRDTIELIKKWSIWGSSLHNEEWKKEVEKVSDAFSRVNVSYGDKEPLLLYDGSSLDIYYESLKTVTTRFFLVRSDNISDLVIKTFNLGSLRLSNIRPLKDEMRVYRSDGTEDILWTDAGYVGCAHIE